VSPPPNSGEAGAYLTCPDCDMLYEVADIPNGSSVLCSRCGALLYARKDNCVQNALAFVITGLILFVPANGYPIMTLKILGKYQSATLLRGVIELFHEGIWVVASLVFLVSIAAPLAELVLLTYVLLPLNLGRVLPGAVTAFRVSRQITKWAMLEVYMLGILVAIVKLKDLADLEMDIGLYSFIGLLLAMVLASVSMNHHEVWERLEANA